MPGFKVAIPSPCNCRMFGASCSANRQRREVERQFELVGEMIQRIHILSEDICPQVCSMPQRQKMNSHWRS